MQIAQSAESKQRDRVIRVYEDDRCRYACENRGKIFWLVNKVNEGEISSICSRRSIPHLCGVERSELAVCRGRQLVADHVQMPATGERRQANGCGRVAPLHSLR